MGLTLLIAVLFKQIPWEGWWLTMRPDFVLIEVLFWALHRPSRVGMAFEAWTPHCSILPQQ